jgi:hypothetical protein
MQQTASDAGVDPWEIAAKAFELSGAVAYYADPVRFALECIDWSSTRGEESGLTDYQREILAALVRQHKISVRGPHGLGKTALMAIVVLWFALTREAARVDWKCVTTAGAWRQLEHYLWPEIKKWAGRVRWDVVGRKPLSEHSELLKLQLTMRIGQAFAAAASDHRKIEGAHADSVLYIFDESKAIDAKVFDAAEGAFSASKTDGSLPEAFALAFSTPGDPAGRFYEIQAKRPGYSDWWVRHVTVQECIAAGRVNREWVDMRRLQWGEESALYHNRVLGQFHSSDKDSVIPLRWVELAVERWQVWYDAGCSDPGYRPVFGVDVARGGKDLTVVAKRIGPYIERLNEYQFSDTMKIVDQLYALMGNQRDIAVVDVIGVGAGVVDAMRRTGFRQVRAYNAARRSKARDRSGDMGFFNQRAAAWWKLREALDPAFDPVVAIPPDDTLIGELVAPKWRLVRDKIQVESKDDIAERIGRSTDHADAVIHSILTDREYDQLADQPVQAFGWTDADASNPQVHSWAPSPFTPDDHPDARTSHTYPDDWGVDVDDLPGAHLHDDLQPIEPISWE